MGQFKTFLNEQKEQNLLLESGFSRILQIMTGLVPSVRTFAIITAENPMNKELSRQENEARNDHLRQRLVDAALGFVQIEGKYNRFENPFFIINISKKEAIEIGKSPSVDQESIIFGIVNGKFDITFQYIELATGAVQERHVWKKEDKPVSTDFGGKKKSPEEKQKRKEEEEKAAEDTNFYSEYKGRRFKIPFFDDEYEKAIFDKGRIDKRLVKECRNIYYAEDFGPELVANVEHRLDDADLLNENVSGKHKWMNRGFAFSMLNKAKKI